MKKLLTAKNLSLLMLLSLLGGKVEAGHYNDDGYYAAEERDCCPSSCYECACNPLYCGAWDLQIQAGVAPVLWHGRDAITGVSCALPVGTSPVVTLLDEAPRYSHLYKLPWLVGGQIGYAMSDNTRVYLEFNYSQARAKTSPLVATTATPVVGGAPVGGFPIVFGLDKYKIFDGYVGARYYWDRWCDRVSFFLGAKVGFVHHKHVNSTFSFASPAPATPTVAATELFHKNTNVSGGLNFGLDVCFCGNWSFVLTGEVVAACGPRNAATLFVDPSVTGVSAISLGHINTELRFPVTAGIRYSF